MPLTDADAGSTLDVEAVLPSADGGAVWLLASDLGPSGRDFVAAQVGLYRTGLGGSPSTPVRLTDAEGVDLLTNGPRGAQRVPRSSPAQGRGAVHLLEVGSDGAMRTLVDGTTVVTGASVGGGRVVVTAATPSSAGDVFVVGEGGGATARTDLSSALRATGHVRVPVELTARSADGYPVHGWVVRPDGAGPHPTILMIHGGPFSHYTHALFDEVQVLAQAGYAVVYGNPRGSSGYGAEHGRVLRGAFGAVDTEDVLALLGQALDDPELDGERVGVMGGSYGGYLTAWLTTRTDRFARGDRRARLLPRPRVELRRLERHRPGSSASTTSAMSRTRPARPRLPPSRRWPTWGRSGRRRWSSTRSRTGDARWSRGSAGSSSSSAGASRPSCCSSRARATS